MMVIDYDAVVPGIDNGKSAPFQVKIDPSKPPGDQRYRDFIPAKGTVAVATKPDVVVKRKTFQRRPVARYTEDYISPEDSAVRRKNEKNSILEIAKQIYAQGSKHRKVYKTSLAMVNDASDMDKREPSKELSRAMKIVARHKPISKTKAMEQAAAQFYGLTG